MQESNKKPTIKTLVSWIIERLNAPPKRHEDKVLQAEIYHAKNEDGEFCLIGKSKTGRSLILALYNFTISCQNLADARQKHDEQTKKDSI